MLTARSRVLFPWCCARCRTSTNSTTLATSQHSLPIRPFSSTPSQHESSSRKRKSRSLNNEALKLSASARIRPESPRYIDVPQAIQQQSVTQPWLKGILPVAREIFPVTDKSALRKASPARLAAIANETRRIRNARGMTPAQTQAARLRERVASLRRENLRAGLAALAARARHRQAVLARRQESSAAERAALLNRSDRPDELLTRPSVTANISETAAEDPAVTAARHAERVARVQAKAAARADTTQAHLHDLYATARTFIVSEGGLDAALEREFGTPAAPRTWRGRMQTVWAEGAPTSLAEMAARAREARLGAGSDERAALMERRMRRVAETLTGGRF